jgi:hypothetical protein
VRVRRFGGVQGRRDAHELAELRDPQVRASEEQIAQLGSLVAIKAMAANLARLVYRMLRYGMKYVDQGAQF